MPKVKANAEPMAKTADKHVCYEEAVQDSRKEVQFMVKAFQIKRGRKPILLREDFCGTAAVCAEWVKSDGERKAIGVDLDAATLKWGRSHHLEGAIGERVRLFCRNVLEVNGPIGGSPPPLETEKHDDKPDESTQNIEQSASSGDQHPEKSSSEEKNAISTPTSQTTLKPLPPVDLVCAYNFANGYFHTRAKLIEYFKVVYASLKDDGLFFLDVFGGINALQPDTRIKKLPSGNTYIAEQKKYDVFTNVTKLTLSFKFPDGSKLKDVFSYDFRLWSLPELREALQDSGFKDVWIWFPEEKEDDADDDEQPEYKEMTSAPNREHWIALLVVGK